MCSPSWIAHKSFNKRIKGIGGNMGEKLLFIAKRLSDLAIEIERLYEKDKQYIIEKAEGISPDSLIELYNILGEYGKLE